MSDLAATNCQSSCNTGCGWNMNTGGCNCSSIIWILLLLSCCGNGNGFGGNDGCDSIIWILLLLCFCGGGNNSGCLGCGGC